MDKQHRTAVIVADGDVDATQLVSLARPLDGERPLVICADAGAIRALSAGVRPDLVVGDADSLRPHELADLRERGIDVELAPAEKDESDLELCVRAAVARGAGRLRLVGALGGRRVEHTVANLLLLGHPDLDGLDVSIVHGPSTVRRVGTAGSGGTIAISGSPRDYISLMPIDTAVEGVTTDGLRYPLHGEPLPVGPTRGLSNELLGERAAVTVERGRLLVIHTARAAVEARERA